jgi:hypothetical protein
MKKAFLSLKFDHLWAIIIIAGIFSFSNMSVIRPNDFWFHIAYGRNFFHTGQLPVNEQFSFTHTGPYPSLYNYWLAQVFYYVVYEIGGAALVVLVSSLLFTGACYLIFRLGLNKTGDWPAAALGTLFAVILGITSANIRPQLLAYPLLAGAMYAIERFQNNEKRWMWGLALSGIMAVWVNSHGTFFLPFALIAFWGLEMAIAAYKAKSFSPLLPPIVLSGYALVGALMNPRGLRVFDFLYRMGTAPTINRYVSEWQPTSLNHLTGWLFFSALIILVLLLVFSHLRFSLAEWLSLILFTLLAIKYTRAVNWFGLTQAMLFTQTLHILSTRRNRKGTQQNNRAGFNFMVAGSMSLLAVISLPWFRPYLPVESQRRSLLVDTPVDAVDFMVQNDLNPNVFADMGFSSYLIWAAPQKYKVFIDPRFEFYSEAIWNDFIKVSYAKGDWANLLEKYQAGTLLLHQIYQRPLIESAQASPHWVRAYEDPMAVIFIYTP